MLWIFSHGHTAFPLIRGKWANDMSARASLVLQRLLLLWVLLHFNIFISGWQIHKWNSCRCATVVTARNLTFSSKTSPVFPQTSRPVSQHGGYLQTTVQTGTDHQVWNTQPHTPATKQKALSWFPGGQMVTPDKLQFMFVWNSVYSETHSIPWEQVLTLVHQNDTFDCNSSSTKMHPLGHFYKHFIP